MPVTAKSKSLFQSSLLTQAEGFYKKHVDKKVSRRVNVRAYIEIRAKTGNYLSSKPKKRRDGTWTNKISASKRKKKGATQSIRLTIASPALLSRKPGALKRQTAKLMEVLEKILSRYESRGMIGRISFKGYSFDAVQSEKKVKGLSESHTAKNRDKKGNGVQRRRH